MMTSHRSCTSRYFSASLVLTLSIALGGCAGSEAAQDGATGSTTASLLAYTVQPGLPSVVVPRDGAGSVTLTVTRSGFVGALPMTLSATTGLVAAVSPNLVLPATAAATQSALLTVRASSTAPLGSGLVSIKVGGSTVATVKVVVRDLPLPTVVVDTALAPADPTAPDDANPAGPPRPVARIADAHSHNDFILGELVVTSDDAAAVTAFAASIGGTLVAQFSPRAAGLGSPDVRLVRFDPAAIGVGDAAQELAAQAPNARGDVRVSSAAALGTLVATTRAQRAGLMATLQMIATPQTYEERVITEAPTGNTKLSADGLNYSANPYTWPHYAITGGQRTGVAEAWRALDIAGRLGNRVKVGIVDQGFAIDDLPTSIVALGAGMGVKSVGTCETAGSTHPCPEWHGLGISQIIAGIHDNAYGAAGVASPVADLTIFHGNRSIYALQEGITAVWKAGARVINISKTIWYGATIADQVDGFNVFTSSVRPAGGIIYASAGNDGRDVDEEDCFLGTVCWEATWVTPCENAGVECVGGTTYNDDRRHPSSAYGAEEVDIFAPWFNSGSSGNDALLTEGTSCSSPYMAGVAALVWAADPSLTADQVVATINATARGTRDSRVPRFVVPIKAVLAALGPQAPTLTITQPSDGASGPYGGMNLVMFVADVDDVEDTQAQLSVAWQSDVDGLLGTGRVLTTSFATPGPRTITATVTDSTGRQTSRSVTYSATNAAPTAIIDAPVADAKFPAGGVLVLSGRGQDANEGPGGLPCSSLTWSIDVAPSFQAVGCSVGATIGMTGPAVVTLHVTDAQGVTAQQSVNIEFTEGPTTGPPYLAITYPSAAAILGARDSHTLTAITSDPDGTAVGMVWLVVAGGTSTVIGVGPSVDWTPSDSMPLRCGRSDVVLQLRAADGNGETTVQEVTITLEFGPC